MQFTMSIIWRIVCDAGSQVVSYFYGLWNSIGQLNCTLFAIAKPKCFEWMCTAEKICIFSLPELQRFVFMKGRARISSQFSVYQIFYWAIKHLIKQHIVSMLLWKRADIFYTQKALTIYLFIYLFKLHFIDTIWKHNESTDKRFTLTFISSAFIASRPTHAANFLFEMTFFLELYSQLI